MRILLVFVLISALVIGCTSVLITEELTSDPPIIEVLNETKEINPSVFGGVDLSYIMINTNLNMQHLNRYKLKDGTICYILVSQAQDISCVTS